MADDGAHPHPSIDARIVDGDRIVAAAAEANRLALLAELAKRDATIAVLGDAVAKLQGTPTPPPSVPPSTVYGTPDHPFSADSVWNKAVPFTPNDARTAALRTLRPWINEGQNSHPIVRAQASDPTITVTDTTHRGDMSWPARTTIQWKVPATATAAPGDGHLHVINPEGTQTLEMVYAKRVGSNIECGRMHVVDLTGLGVGPMNGTRAWGGPAEAGLIRSWEIKAGKIDHALAVALPNSHLKYTVGKAGYSNGYGTALGYVAPATEQDWDSPYAYKGIIPMGSRISIPASASLAGLTPEVAMIGQALQTYGGMVVDRCSDGDLMFYAEQDPANGAWVDAATGPWWTRAELQKLVPLVAAA